MAEEAKAMSEGTDPRLGPGGRHKLDQRKIRAARNVAIVTGSTSGIGRAAAKDLGKAGWYVMVHGRDELGGEEVVAQAKSLGGTAAFVPADLREADSCEGLVGYAAGSKGRIDLLVNNTGVNAFTSVTGPQIEDWQSCLDLDLRACWLCSRAAVPHMLLGSAIVNVAPNHALATIPGCFPVQRSQSGDAGGHGPGVGAGGIRVNAVCPGYIDTPVNDAYFSASAEPNEERERVVGLHPLGRLGIPEDVARSVRFLALEEESGFITGSVLLVDGGRGALTAAGFGVKRAEGHVHGRPRVSASPAFRNPSPDAGTEGTGGTAAWDIKVTRRPSPTEARS